MGLLDFLLDDEEEKKRPRTFVDFFEDDRPADPMDGWDTYGKKKKSDFDIEDWRSVSEDRRYRAQGSGNWSSHEDWSCGDHEDHPDNYLEGWDSYEDNTF